MFRVIFNLGNLEFKFKIRQLSFLYSLFVGNGTTLMQVSNNLTDQQRKDFHVSSSTSSENAVDGIDSFVRPNCSTPLSINATLVGMTNDVYPTKQVKSPLPRVTLSGSNILKTADENLVQTKIALLKSHRRNRSLDVNLKLTSALSTKLDSQEYDIISDSELPSSLDQCSDEYLVVDGFIGPTVGSFTPSAADENSGQDDPLFHMRLGLFNLLQDVLTLLPDNLITRIFGTILKVEHLLVLVNQENTRLREIAVKVCLHVKTFYVCFEPNARLV